MTARAAIDGDDLRVRIHRHLTAHPGRTAAQLERAIPASIQRITAMLTEMADDGEAQAAAIRTGRGLVRQWWAT